MPQLSEPPNPENSLDGPRPPDDLEGRLVWIFGSPRTGSSWLMRMLAEVPEVQVINETYLPLHLVPIAHRVRDGEYLEHGVRADDPNFFFARRYLPALGPELRRLILNGLIRQVRELGGNPDRGWLVVKEPNGSHAADTTLSLLPRSRLVFLLRDGRDVIDSLLDAMLGKDTWWREQQQRTAAKPTPDRLAFTRHHAALWRDRTESVQRAFEALPPERRFLLRYEELLEHTVTNLGRILQWLGLDVAEQRISEIASSHSFDAIPEAERGPGKEARAASPGLWRQHLSDEEQAMLEDIMGPTLRELGYS